MQRRNSLAHLILASVIILGLTMLMVCVEAQTRIAFVSNRDGNWEIYVIDIDGQNTRRLTNNPDNDYAPSWSPDGKRIAFVSDRDGHFIGNMSTSEIYVMDADGGNPQNLTNNPSNDLSPSWSPDGKRIAFASVRRDKDGNLRRYDIYVMDADGKNQQRLTDNPHGDQYPSWSPDGKRIVFSSRREGHFENRFGITYDIYVMDADGKNQQRLTNNRQNDWFPSWSPDGKYIAFASDRKGGLQNFDIYVVDADGKNQQRLTNNHVYDWSPSWSPDGERIAFTSERDGNAETYVMDADGKNQQNLTNHPHGDGNPAWFDPAFAAYSRPGHDPLGQVRY